MAPGIIWSEFLERAGYFAFTVALFTPLELYLTHERHSIAGRLIGVVYWVLWTFAALATLLFLSWLWPAIGLDIPEAIRLPLSFEWAGWWAPILSPLAIAFVGDLGF